jgi:O-antigen/teichoic acid export membrane protein
MGSFLKHAAVYGLAAALVQAAGFLLLPMYLRFLGPADYGALEVVTRFAESVSTLLVLGGCRQALFALYKQAEDGDSQRRIVCAAFALVAAFCLGGGGLLLLAAPWLASFLGGDALGSWTLRLGVLTILLEPFMLLPLSMLQARMSSLAYVSVTFGQFALRVALSVLFVAWLGWGAEGVLGAVAVTGACFGVGLTAWELSRGMAWPRWADYRALLAFALPLVPGGICFFLLHHGDRFLLLRTAAAAEVGVYGLGYKLGMLVSMFGFAPFYMVWSARMYEVARQPDAPREFGRMFTRLMAGQALAGLALCLLAEDLVLALGGPAYRGAAWVAPLVVLACILQSAATLFDAAMFLRRRTGLKLEVTAGATAVMLALYGMLIPEMGGKGAALATLGGFAFLAAATFGVSQRLFRVRYEWGRLGGLALLVALLWGVGMAQPWGLGGKVALCVAAPWLMMAALGDDEEWSLARSAWARLGLIRLGRRTELAGR